MAQPQNPSPKWFLRRDHFVQDNAHGPGQSPNKHLPGILRISAFGSTRVLILRTTCFVGITGCIKHFQKIILLLSVKYLLCKMN
jgi:hypothetical protein